MTDYSDEMKKMPTEKLQRLLQQAIDKSHAAGDRCDFCSEGGAPVKDYPCDDFDWTFSLDPEQKEFITERMEGEWGACVICAALVDAEKWGALAERSAKTSELPMPAEYFRDLHAEFQRHRKFVN